GGAAWGRPQEADELALADLEGDAVEGGERAEALGQAVDAEVGAPGRGGGWRHRATRRPLPSPYFFSALALYRFSHSARILARFVAAHWKSFFAMCSSMLAGRYSMGLAMPETPSTA